MERITVNMPDPIQKKLRRYAHKNDLSMSASALKLIELALAIDSKKSKKDEENHFQNDPVVEAKINELIVQNAVILKEILYEGFNFEPRKMDEIKDKITKTKALVLNKSA